MLVRVYLAQGRYPEAIEVLERFGALANRPGDVATTIEFLALQAVALHDAGQREHAHSVAARLLALTQPDGYVRLYLDAGEPMRQVLLSLDEIPHSQETSHAPVPAAYIKRLLAAFPRTEAPGLRDQIPERSALSPHPSALVEPLTRREQEVLRSLAAGASNQEIAAQLVISLATVKKHISNLLGKLGVRSRTQAIARARDWSILE
jgi:LuxR family maltose regulon positive regulatory protein